MTHGSLAGQRLRIKAADAQIRRGVAKHVQPEIGKPHSLEYFGLSLRQRKAQNIARCFRQGRYDLLVVNEFFVSALTERKVLLAVLHAGGVATAQGRNDRGVKRTVRYLSHGQKI